MNDRKCFERGGPHLARDCPTNGSTGAVKAIGDGLIVAMQPFLCVCDPEPAPRQPRPRRITLADFPVKHVANKVKTKNSSEAFSGDRDPLHGGMMRKELRDI